MNQIRGKPTHQRNITPNFVRFKRTRQLYEDISSSKKQGSQEPKDDVRNTERSSSKASRCSFEVYEKRILNMNKLSTCLSYSREHAINQKTEPRRPFS